MTFKEFVSEAIKTESPINPLKDDVKNLGLSHRVLHSILGIATEWNEYHDALNKGDKVNALEELGDILWYLAVLADEVGLESVEGDEDCLILDIDPLDLCKKTLFYGKKFDNELIKKYTIKTFYIVTQEINFLDGDIHNVMETI